LFSQSNSNMAKIILLEKPAANISTRPGLPVYVLAAWQLSRAALWPFEKLKPSAIRRCKEFITGYLSATEDAKTAFITYCQRILLYNRLLAASSTMPIDTPLIWLNPVHKGGYAATSDIARLMESSRLVRPVYLEGVAALADGYCQYLHQPTPVVLSRLHTKLSRLKQYGLLQLLGHIVLQQSLSTKQRV
jgi:hypothetical protein